MAEPTDEQRLVRASHAAMLAVRALADVEHRLNQARDEIARFPRLLARLDAVDTALAAVVHEAGELVIDSAGAAGGMTREQVFALLAPRPEGGN